VSPLIRKKNCKGRASKAIPPNAMKRLKKIALQITSYFIALWFTDSKEKKVWDKGYGLKSPTGLGIIE